MGFGEHLGPALDVMHSTMGESVTVQRAGDPGTSFEASGIFADEESLSEVEGALIASNVHMVDLKASEVPWRPRKQDRVLHAGKTWVVAKVVEDGEGIVSLQLHKDD